jgi:molybdopterin-guanine dinucleotide biosynthesis protein A
MGQNKALMLFHGIPLIQRVAHRVIPVAAEVNIISSDEAEYRFLNLPVIPDRIPGKGVLGGIHTALLVSNYPFIAPVGCDLPFLSATLLQAELNLIMECRADVVIPESQNGLEPLHTVYRQSTCLPLVERSLLDGDNRIVNWFSNAVIRILSLAEITQVDPDPRIFLNLNRPEEFTQATEITGVDE